jgi:hypothetical protein
MWPGRDRGRLVVAVVTPPVFDRPPFSADWTVDAETGRSNSSPEFNRLVAEIARLIRDDAHMLIRGQTESTARLILAHLTHEHGMVTAASHEAMRVKLEETIRHGAAAAQDATFFRKRMVQAEAQAALLADALRDAKALVAKYPEILGFRTLEARLSDALARWSSRQ